MSFWSHSSRQKPTFSEDFSQFSGGILANGAAIKWLGLAFLLFLLQTLPYLTCRWLPDESWYSAPAYSIEHGNGIADPAIGSNDMENRFDARPPGTAIAIAAAFRVFGTSVLAARLVSVLAGLATIFLAFQLVRDVIGEQGALIVAFVVATDNLIVLTARTARPEALTTMAILASMLLMKQFAKRGDFFWAFLSGLMIALGTMFHITLLGYIISLGILAIVVDCRRGGFPLRGAFAFSSGYFLGLLPFIAWIFSTPLGRTGFAGEYLSRASGVGLWSKFLMEGSRYADLLGINLLHGHGLEALPVRLPIPLCFLAASFLLWKLRRQWFYLELLFLTPTVFWLIYTVNKTSRYFALLAPVFAFAIGAAVVAATSNRRLYRVVFALSILVVVAQMSANFFLLHAASKANYNRVAEELRAVIPQGQTAYGSITFWMALHDHPYISYERTAPWMAANQFHARYFIAGDRVMTNGLPGDEAFYEKLRADMSGIIAHSKLVGQVQDAYYGDVKIYELQSR